METIPRIGVGVIVKNKGQILLGLRKHALGEGLWAFPGGHLEFGESPDDTAIRECREETGLEVAYPKTVAITNDLFCAEKKHYITIFVEVDYLGGIPCVLEPDKCETWCWFPWDKLPAPLFQTIKSLQNTRYQPFLSTHELYHSLRIGEAPGEG